MGVKNKRGRYVPQEPTPDEIEAACREIRMGWSEIEHRLRAGLPKELIDRRHEYHVPVVSTRKLLDEADLEEE